MGVPFPFIKSVSTPIISAQLAYERTLATAGASLFRDAIYQRILEDVARRSGAILDSQESSRDDQGVLHGIHDISMSVRDDRFLSGVDDSFNTWNNIPVSASDFLSLDDTIARGPRQPEGSLPVRDFCGLQRQVTSWTVGLRWGCPVLVTRPTWCLCVADSRRFQP